MRTTFGIGPPANRSKMKDIRRNGLIFFLFTQNLPQNMAQTDVEALRRVAEQILMVIPDRRPFEMDQSLQNLLESRIDLHWGKKIRKVLKVLTPVEARRQVPSQYIGDLLELWKLKIISQWGRLTASSIV